MTGRAERLQTEFRGCPVPERCCPGTAPPLYTRPRRCRGLRVGAQELEPRFAPPQARERPPVRSRGEEGSDEAAPTPHKAHREGRRQRHSESSAALPLADIWLASRAVPSHHPQAQRGQADPHFHGLVIAGSCLGSPLPAGHAERTRLFLRAPLAPLRSPPAGCSQPQPPGYLLFVRS